MSEPNIIFRGDADLGPRLCVTVHAPGVRVRTLPLRLDLCNHSPSGFGWGYNGSGPAQLALAILAEVTRDHALALRMHQDFKREVIAGLAMDRGWQIDARQVREWLALQPEIERLRQVIEQ
jgi:hypothetical protein